MAELPLTGGCLCGGVRYEISEPLVSAGYCHCTRCQRRTGTAASAQGRIVPGSLRIVQGEELVREWKPEQGFGKCFCAAAAARSGAGIPRARSGACGSGRSTPIPACVRRTGSSPRTPCPWEPIPDDGTTRYPEGRDLGIASQIAIIGLADGRSQRSTRTSSRLGKADAAGGRPPGADVEEDRRPAPRHDRVRVVLDHREVAVLRRDPPQRLAAAVETPAARRT